MLHKYKLLFLGIAIILVTGCSTSAIVKIPPGTDLYVHDRPTPVEVSSYGRIQSKPFFWSAAGGIKYKLVKDGETIKSGKMRAKFRTVSIFWPPFALIYWPMGFNPTIVHDLTE